MKPERLIKKLRKFGLTAEEAAMYLFLLQVKSATIQEIHNSKEYCLKQRSNLYKTLNNLRDKNCVVEEIKGGKKRFFPISPHLILENYLKEQEQILKKLKELASKMTENLDILLKTPFEGFNPIPEPLVEFISGVIDENWGIKEPPEILKNKALGAVIYSIEFITHRKFAGDSAGLVLYEFRYQQHRDESLEEVREFQRQQYEQALKKYDGQGFFQIEDYWIEKKVLNLSGILNPYDEFHIKSNISSDSASGSIVLLFQEYPLKIIALWAANLQDFFDLVKRLTQKFTLIENIINI